MIVVVSGFLFVVVYLFAICFVSILEVGISVWAF